MANEKNLIPLNKRTKKEQRKIATEGGIASGKARREKKTFQELAKTLLSLDVKSGKSHAVMQQMGIESEDMQYKTLCVLGMMKAAQNGNVNAFEKLQDLTGELYEEGNSIEDLTALGDMLK